MRIIIVGGGVVGFSLAEHLLREGHNLTLIERNDKRCGQISDKLDMQIITGNGARPRALKEAGIDGADMVLAVTPNNEVNIVVCSIAAQYGVSRRIARLRGDELSGESDLVDLDKLGVTWVIHPERAMVDHILQFVETPHAVESANFENGRILMRGYRVTAEMPLASKTPLQIRQEIAPEAVLFPAIVRQGRGMIPDGETEILPGDILYTLFSRETLDTFLRLVNVEKKEGRKIIITGDSFSTLVLAQALDNTGHHINLVDPSPEHARAAADAFNKIEVLNGDCTEVDLLRELNVDKASFFIAASDEVDYNMFSCLLAKAEGAHEVIAVSVGAQHDKLFNSIGIDHVINPRLTTAREILEIISLGQIGAVVKLSDVDIEAVRFTVEPGSTVAGKSVIKIARKLKKGSIIGVVVRGDTMILPDGETVIEENDHVILITRHKNVPPVTKLFQSRATSKRS